MDYNNIQKEIHKVITDYTRLHPIAECGLQPILDGLTNPEMYAKAPIKIMFMLKEAYDYDKKTRTIGSGGWNHTDYLNDKGEYDYNIITEVKTHQRVSMIATGILRGLSYDNPQRKVLTEFEVLSDFKSLAWINVGKFPAPDGVSTSPARLRTVYNYWKEILFRQIEEYTPDVIIFGNTFSVFKNDLMPFRTVSKEWPTHVYRDKNVCTLMPIIRV